MKTETICFSTVIVLLIGLLWYEQHESNRNLTEIIKVMQNPAALCAVKVSQIMPDYQTKDDRKAIERALQESQMGQPIKKNTPNH